LEEAARLEFEAEKKEFQKHETEKSETYQQILKEI
jgi:hypothetical protein